MIYSQIYHKYTKKRLEYSSSTKKKSHVREYLNRNIFFHKKKVYGILIKRSMDKSGIMRKNKLRWLRKYNGYQRNHKNYPFSLCKEQEINIGDNIILCESRPLSKSIVYVSEYIKVSFY